MLKTLAEQTAGQVVWTEPQAMLAGKHTAYLGKDPLFVSRYSLSPFWTSSSSLLQSFKLANRRGSGHRSITYKNTHSKA